MSREDAMEAGLCEIIGSDMDDRYIEALKKIGTASGCNQTSGRQD